MASNFPTSLDNDASIGLINNNISQIGGQVINQLRAAVFAIESNIGLGAQGATSSIASRLSTSLDPNGNILPSAIASMGLVTLPIVNSMIGATAGIQESKLALNYTTAYLNNFITNVNIAAQTSLSFIANHGYKLEPHIAGTGYNHDMNAILVAASSAQYFNNSSGAVRNNTNLYTLFNDINNDLITHEVANGTPVSIIDGLQFGGTLPPINYAHISAGIYVDPNTFSFIPQTVTDVQTLAEFIDSSNILILGTRIQTLYSNGIPVNARAGALPNQTLGQLIIPQTNAQAYLLYGGANTPVDSIDHGDDLVEFLPSSAAMANNSFDGLFNLVKIGDILTVDYDGYGSFTVQYIIREIKYSVSGGNKRYVVRINGKNILNTPVLASINSPLFDNNKYGVMALAQSNNIGMGVPSSLIAGSPRGAEVLSVGFDPDLINSTHYLLYMNVYPDGNPLDQVVPIPPIDISGNLGATPGSYTLDGVCETINNTFRSPGFNNRFMAFQWQGELGIKMTDGINNISFSIINGVVNSSGLYDQSLSNTSYPNNAIGVPGIDLVDATGFGPTGAGVSSPPFSSTYSSPVVALIPTKVWCPLSRKTYYVNGVERESFAIEPFQLIDGYGDGYWPSTIISKNIIPGVRVEVTYQVPFDLATSGIEIGKTITAIAQSGGTFVDDGRFVISNILFNNCALCGNPDIISTTNITVYDAVQSPSGDTPYASAPVGTEVFLYYNSSAISFNAENMSDWAATAPFTRSMEVYVNQDGYTFTQERGRMNISGGTLTLNTPSGTVDLYSSSSLNNLNMVAISPTLRGFAFGTIDKINITLTSYTPSTGIFSGYLCKWDGSTESEQGPATVGKLGNVVRFYDNSYVEYIDFAVDFDNPLLTFSTTQRTDIQLFPSLQLDEEIMLLGTVLLENNDIGLNWLQDDREYGNVSVEQLTTSALNYISTPTQLINENGIVRGFNIISASTGSGIVVLDGGVAVVNGKIIQLGSEVITVPAVVEVLYPGFTTQISTITWYLCVNDAGELQLIASTDYSPIGSPASLYIAAGLDQTRQFYVSNTTIPNNYPIRGTYFADLILNNRDLTPIAVITATTSGSPASITSITAFDARRFITNGYSGLASPFVLSNNGSFQSFAALNTWLDQLVNLNAGATDGLNSIGTDVIVKGSFDITSSTTLSYSAPVRFIGDSGTFQITTANAFTLGSHVSFENLTFNYNYDPLVSGDAGYSTTDWVNSQNGCIYCSVSLNQNISIKDCIFNWVPTSSSTTVNRYPFISFQFTTLGDVIEGVNITNNIFNSTLPIQPDIRAAVAFISTIITEPALNVGVQLVNANISNNTCYQDQMCIISAFLDGSFTLDCAITTINTNISNNIFGTIGIITRYYDLNDFKYFNVSPGGKSQSLTISNNTCKLIDALDAQGAEVFFSLLVYIDMITGAYIIENNTVSWIRLLLHANTTVGRPTSAIIKNNNLSAYNTSYRLNYNAIYSPSTSDNAAISLVNTSVFDGYGKVIVDGNIIDQGQYTSSSSSLETYSYDVGVLTGHKSTIVNNVISNLAQTINATEPVGINLINPVSIVQGNKLTRNSNNWTSYISGGSAFFPLAQHIITDNFFDQVAPGITNTLDIANLPVYSIAYDNINQIQYQAISLTDNKYYYSANGSGSNNGGASHAYPANFAVQDNTNDITIGRVFGNTISPQFPADMYLKITDNTNTTIRNLSITVPLDTSLPPNVKILNITLGVFLVRNVSPALSDSGTNNIITLTILGYPHIAPNSGVSANGIADVKANLTPFGADYAFQETTVQQSSIVINSLAVENSLASSTQYCTILLPTPLPTASGSHTAASIDLNYVLASSSVNITWYLSPLLVEYQW